MSDRGPAPPPRRYTSPTGRIVIPVLLVVLLIVVLGRPILISGLELDTPRPDPVPTRASNATQRPELRRVRLAAPYPKRCLSEIASRGLGLVAASDGVSITVGTPTGANTFSLQARPPVGFSASGSFLATAGGDVWTARGKHVGVAFARPVKRWAWSPTGDCIAGIDDRRLVVAQPGTRAVVLLDDLEVSTFSFSPDGSRIVFAVESDRRSTGIWMADLRTRDAKILQRSLGWELIGWTRAMQPFMLRTGSNARAGLGFPPSDEVADCGDDILRITSHGIGDGGISGPPEYLRSDDRFRYSALACAPRGDLLLVVRSEKGDRRETSMAVLRRNGSFVREVAQQSTVEDAPMWGPAGTGVIFVGDVGGEGAVGPLVWFLPEGGTARPTGLRIDKFGNRIDARLDWSATPPLGHPTD